MYMIFSSNFEFVAILMKLLLFYTKKRHNQISEKLKKNQDSSGSHVIRNTKSAILSQ